MDNAAFKTTGDLPTSAATTVAVTASPCLIPTGTKLRIGTTNVHVDVVLTVDTPVSGTTLTFTSVTPGADVPIGSFIAIGDSVTTPDAACGNYGPGTVLTRKRKVDQGEVYADLTVSNAGAWTDIS
jgi:hypothetical protein